MSKKELSAPDLGVGSSSFGSDHDLPITIAAKPITTRDRNIALAVAVEDSGPGIDKDQLGDIFTAFATTKPHGMGLGLAISRMIIDYHGGQLTAASDSKYGGASFQFVLPFRE